jgi:uncharacterized membrane protein YdjX (TVP38/TMEM64 family)
MWGQCVRQEGEKDLPSWSKLLGWTLIGAVWILLSQVLPLQAWLVALMGWIDTHGTLGLVAFVFLYVPVCVLVFPDTVANLAAGMLWGVGWGTVAVSLGRGLGSAATFLIARRITRRWLARRMASDPRFAAVVQAIGKEGFKTVFLLRLCPLFPANVLNYALGITPVTFRAYVGATLLGMLPRTLLIAYVGSGTRTLGELAQGMPSAAAAPQVLYWAGLAATLLAAVYISRLAHRALKEATAAAA